MPLPVVAVLAGQGTGKLKATCEFSVTPLPTTGTTPLPQQVKMLERVYHETGRTVAAKQGVYMI